MSPDLDLFVLPGTPAGDRAASAALRALSARLDHLFAATGGRGLLAGDPARSAKSRAARDLARRLAVRDRDHHRDQEGE